MEEQLTSLDYADYIRYQSIKRFSTALNKTQVNKMLYICYGLALATPGIGKLFDDDTPKAWPFGPVFPRVYKKFDKYNGVSKAVMTNIESNSGIKEIIDFVVGKFHTWTAYQLSTWSHQSSGPWYKTVYKDGGTHWNAEIPDELIKEYFTPSSSNAK